ncbi:hypothetical protein NKR19_g5837 [Coniochaeta hoffmannii]|uniref:Uncharacterized protein n=1 Tax=Coniochaeta hoffmannii TaxID=91930 RepID=A0AA38VRW2_9PEZI|nr:hypothetical protein NKR19_g5837 [Coniochaeta hoffmannii]
MADPWKNLRIEKELKPFLHRYGIEYPPNANKTVLVGLLEAQEVPLDRITATDGPTPQLNEADVLGLDQITKDFPPNSGSHFQFPKNNSPGDGSNTGPNTGSNTGPNTGSNSSNNGPTTRSIQRVKDLPGYEDHERQAQAAGLPAVTEALILDHELALLTDYPVAKECLPIIQRGLDDSEVKEKVRGLIKWFASRARSANIHVAHAMVFFDSYLTADKFNAIDYLCDKDNAQTTWFEAAPNPKSRKQAAKRLSNLWDIALNPTSAASQDAGSDGTTPADEAEFFMVITDPYDGEKTKARVIGKHMTKTKVLGVRADSLSNEYPDLGRGYWIECKQGSELEAYNKYVKGPNRKLESADALLLSKCTSPDSFDLDCVFTMKWGKSYHWYGYGRPKNDPALPKMMFSRSTLNNVWKGASITMRALEHHLKKVGQDVPLTGSTDTLDQITLRAKRKVPIIEEEEMSDDTL